MAYVETELPNVSDSLRFQEWPTVVGSLLHVPQREGCLPHHQEHAGSRGVLVNATRPCQWLQGEKRSQATEQSAKKPAGRGWGREMSEGACSMCQIR